MPMIIRNKWSFPMKRSANSAALIALLITTVYAVIGLSRSASASEVEEVYDRVKHGYADSAGVKIHYAMLGPTSGSAKAPLIVMNYYKQNYPAPPYLEDTSPVVKVKPPVLLIHGLDDKALMHGALNHTWEWLERDLTLVTIPWGGALRAERRR